MLSNWSLWNIIHKLVNTIISTLMNISNCLLNQKCLYIRSYKDVKYHQHMVSESLRAQLCKLSILYTTSLLYLDKTYLKQSKTVLHSWKQINPCIRHQIHHALPISILFVISHTQLQLENRLTIQYSNDLKTISVIRNAASNRTLILHHMQQIYPLKE